MRVACYDWFMKISPLAFTTKDYNRNVLILGKMPEGVVFGNEGLVGDWEKEIAESEFLKERFKVVRLKLEVLDKYLEMAKKSLSFEDEFFEEIAPFEERQKIKMVVPLEDERIYEEKFLAPVLAEARLKKVTFVLTRERISDLPEGVQMAIFGNVDSFIIGEISQEERKKLIERKCFGEDSEKLNKLKEGRYITRWFNEDNGRACMFLGEGGRVIEEL